MPPTQTTSMYQQIIAFNWEKLDYFYGDDRKARLFLWVTHQCSLLRGFIASVEYGRACSAGGFLRRVWSWHEHA